MCNDSFSVLVQQARYATRSIQANGRTTRTNCWKSRHVYQSHAASAQMLKQKVLRTCTARRRATAVASLMTPSPNTRLYSRGLRSCLSTCSTATESVAAKMAPSAKQSCRQTHVDL